MRRHMLHVTLRWPGLSTLHTGADSGPSRNRCWQEGRANIRSTPAAAINVFFSLFQRLNLWASCLHVCDFSRTWSRLCVTRSACWGVFADVATHHHHHHHPPPPRRGLFVVRGGLILHKHVSKRSDILSFTPCYRRSCGFVGRHCLAFIFSHILFLLCLKCGMTSSPRHGIVQSNRMPLHRICVMSLFMFVYVSVSPTNEKLLHRACE